MKKKYILLSALLFASLFPVTAGAQVFDHKTRKELERENNQLRKRLETLQQEIDWLRKDAQERDSLEKVMEQAGVESEAAGMEAVDYFDSPSYNDKSTNFKDNTTDSLLSVWYLHRQARKTRRDRDITWTASALPRKFRTASSSSASSG